MKRILTEKEEMAIMIQATKEAPFTLDGSGFNKKFDELYAKAIAEKAKA